MHLFYILFVISGAIEIKASYLHKNILAFNISAEVDVSLHLESIEMNNLNKMDLKASGYLSQNWRSKDNKQFWTNNRFMWNRLKVVPLNNYMKLGAFDLDCTFSETVVCNEKITIHPKCSKYFKHFPYDEQICEIRFASAYIPIENVKLVWQNPVVINNLDLDDFDLVDVVTSNEVDLRMTGNYSSAVVEIVLQRRPFRYIVSIFIPVSISVIITYISTFINDRFAKILTSFFSFFCIFMLYFYNTSYVYPVSYMKVLDNICFISLFFSLVIFMINLLLNECTQITNNNKEDVKIVNIQVYCWKTFSQIVLPTVYIIAIIYSI